MISFSLFGIPISVLPWFWITMALIGGGLRADSKEDIFRLLLFVVAGFISILVHELGHGLTARHFGKRVDIVLQAFGGYAAYSGGTPLSRPRTFMITAAGPAIQIVLGLVTLVVLRNSSGMAPNGLYFLWALTWVSIIWAVLNLLPVLPLDGGRLLESLLGPQRVKLTLGISAAVGLAVCILSLTVFSQPFLAVFLGMFAYQSFQALRQVP